MPMTGYTKLFGSIVASTIWREPHETRIVWITMLAMANKNGIVEASLPGLADMARVSVDECKAAIAALEGPDEYSRTKDHDGKRIAPVDGGWAVLNHAKYRAKMGVDERREYLTEKKREERARKSVNSTSTNVNKCRVSSTVSTQAEADTNTQSASEPKEKKQERPSGYAVPACFESIEGFSAALAGWIEARKAKRNPATGRAIQILIDRLAEKPERAIEALNTATERGWATVKWDWLENANRSNGNGGLDKSKTLGLRPGEGIPMFDPMTGETTILEPK